MKTESSGVQPDLPDAQKKKKNIQVTDWLSFAPMQQASFIF